MSSTSLSHRHTVPVASSPGRAYYTRSPASLPEPLTSRGSQTTSHNPRSQSPPSTSSASSSATASWDPSRVPFNTSTSTLENARYSLESGSKPDHPNEDRYFASETRTFKAFAVFDGHDGERAVGFASSYLRELFYNPSWERAVASGGEIVPKALEEFFKATDREFFKSIRSVIDEVQTLKAAIPPVSVKLLNCMYVSTMWFHAWVCMYVYTVYITLYYVSWHILLLDQSNGIHVVSKCCLVPTNRSTRISLPYKSSHILGKGLHLCMCVCMPAL